MELTEDNFEEFAAAFYDNHFCISEEEFESDLRQIITVRRMMSKHINGNDTNLRLLINNIIIFYNVFDHHAATKMLEMKLDSFQVPYFNAVLKFLSLPMLIPPDDINYDLYHQLQEEFK